METHVGPTATESPAQGLPLITEAQGYFARLEHILRRVPYETVDHIVAQLLKTHAENRTLFLFGNGGSASLASHMACDLGKGTSTEGVGRFRVISLTDNIPTITAWANDASYDDIFTEQMKNLAAPKDTVLAISGSGNSPNVLNGLHAAREIGCYTIGLTGFQGGKLRDLCDLCLVVPSDNMQFIEDVHVSISHCVFTAVRHQMSLQKAPLKARAAFTCAAD